jgi:hypothetical protein
VNRIPKENYQDAEKRVRVESPEKEKESTLLLLIMHPEKAIVFEIKSSRKFRNRG